MWDAYRYPNIHLMFLTPQMNIFNKKKLFASTINLIHDYHDF